MHDAVVIVIMVTVCIAEETDIRAKSGIENSRVVCCDIMIAIVGLLLVFDFSSLVYFMQKTCCAANMKGSLLGDIT